MRPAASRRPHRPGIAWLLCLALLLAFAQSGAMRHGVSHALAEIGAQTTHKSAALPGTCDQCLAGAALGFTAAPGAPPPWHASRARYAPPPAVPASVWPAERAHAYLSRAPPPGLH
jgi:hypothetical protein